MSILDWTIVASAALASVGALLFVALVAQELWGRWRR